MNTKGITQVFETTYAVGMVHLAGTYNIQKFETTYAVGMFCDTVRVSLFEFETTYAVGMHSVRENDGQRLIRNDLCGLDSRKRVAM